MAVNLTAVFRVRDQGTSRLRRITQMMNRMTQTSHTAAQGMNHYRDANGRLHDSLGRFVAETNHANTSTGLFATRVNSLRVGTNGLSASLGGMQSALIGLAGAYIGANGAAKLLNATIGEAAKFEQSKAIIQAAFQDDNATKQYMKMVDKMAIDSPLLNSGDMFAGSKGLLTLTKDMKQLGTAWKLVERLVASDPTKSIDDAVRGLRELSSGDTISLREVFNLDKNILNDVKGGSFEEQLAGIDKALNKMNITQNTVEAMGSTTLGRFNSLKERLGTFFRDMGAESNTKLGAFLQRINDAIDTKIDVKSLSDKLGGLLGKVTDKAIGLYDLFVRWRKPIAYAAGAFATFVGALAVVGTIAALSNPIALIAMGISAAAVGFKALYDNSETFRGIIDSIVGKVKTLWSAFKTGGAGGLISALFPPDIANQINSVVDGIKTKVRALFDLFKVGGVRGVLKALFSSDQINAIMTRVATMKEQFSSVFTSIYNVVVPVLQSLWGIVKPILNGLWTNLKIIADIAVLAWNNVLAPAIQFITAAFQMFWGVTGPILKLFGAVLGVVFQVLRLGWDTIVGPFVAFLAGAFTQAFGAATEIVKALTPVFQTVGNWISTAAGYLKEFASILGNIKMPDWIGKIGSGAVSWAKKLIPGNGGKPDGSHYHGLARVPSNNYRALLHRNEMVLTAQEADQYRSLLSGRTSGSSFDHIKYEQVERGVVNKATYKSYSTTNVPSSEKSTPSVVNITPTFNVEKMEVRENADIDKIALGLAKLIEKQAMQVAY
ncbi:phage tail tape measure protein [Lysinibacillus fusiformis]|uniref:phage tail protein n=1 Tax=Lysinibacillus fusiformis TaxID=28031 RepID=UPI00196899AA|nr:phage tail tape measure protein [Lysinibacillus fusiformis]QSB10750.1 phage tail tape measure protein [Lysinibacillus fusiformis]